MRRFPDDGFLDHRHVFATLATFVVAVITARRAPSAGEDKLRIADAQSERAKAQLKIADAQLKKAEDAAAARAIASLDGLLGTFETLRRAINDKKIANEVKGGKVELRRYLIAPWAFFDARGAQP